MVTNRQTCPVSCMAYLKGNCSGVATGSDSNQRTIRRPMGSTIIVSGPCTETDHFVAYLLDSQKLIKYRIQKIRQYCRNPYFRIWPHLVYWTGSLSWPTSPNVLRSGNSSEITLDSDDTNMILECLNWEDLWPNPCSQMALLLPDSVQPWSVEVLN